MNELTGNNEQLQSHTASSQEMTTDISSQVEKCTLIIYLAAHIYIVAVLRSLFISHILVFLVPII